MNRVLQIFLSLAFSSLTLFLALYLSVFWGVGRGMTNFQAAILALASLASVGATIAVVAKRVGTSCSLHSAATLALIVGFAIAWQGT